MLSGGDWLSVCCSFFLWSASRPSPTVRQVFFFTCRSSPCFSFAVGLLRTVFPQALQVSSNPEAPRNFITAGQILFYNSRKKNSWKIPIFHEFSNFSRRFNVTNLIQNIWTRILDLLHVHTPTQLTFLLLKLIAVTALTLLIHLQTNKFIKHLRPPQHIFEIRLKQKNLQNLLRRNTGNGVQRWNARRGCSHAR